MGIRFVGAYAALYMPFGVVTVYLQVLLRERGFCRDEIGLIQGVLGAMAVLAPPLWGYISDRTGRPKVILASVALASPCAFLLLGATAGLMTALGAIVLFGLFSQPLIPLTDGFALRYVHTHGGDYGRVRVAGSVSFIMTLLLLEALGIGGRNPTAMILAAMLAVGLLHFLSILALPQPGVHASATNAKRYKPDLRLFLKKRFVLFTLCVLLGRMAMMSYYHFFTLFLKEELGFEAAGLLWVIGPLSEIPIIYFSTRIMKRIGVKNLFALGLLGCMVRLVCFSFATNVWQVIPLQCLHALTFGAFFTASVTYVSRLVPAEMKSSAQTLFAGLSTGLGSLLGGALGGVVAENYGFAVLYRVFGGIAFVALVILMVFVPREEEETPPGVEAPAA